MKNNCELVIATDLECRNHKVLYRGSYSEIANITTKYDDSDDIRRIYKKNIDSFLSSQKDGEKGDIVIIETIKHDNGVNYNRLKVLYKKDKIVSKYLLKCHDVKSDFYLQWLRFWDNIVNYKKYIYDYRYISLNDSEETKKAKIEINFRIDDCDKILKNLSCEIKKYLSDYHKYNWDPIASSYYFIRNHFNPFKKYIKENNCEAEIMNIIVKAFDIFCKKCKLQGKKYTSSKDILNLYEERIKNKSNSKLETNEVFNQYKNKEDVGSYDLMYNNYTLLDNLRRSFCYSKKPIIESNMHSRLYNQIQKFLNNGGIIEDVFNCDELLLYSSLTNDEFNELSSLKQESRYIL